MARGGPKAWTWAWGVDAGSSAHVGAARPPAMQVAMQVTVQVGMIDRTGVVGLRLMTLARSLGGDRPR